MLKFSCFPFKDKEAILSSKAELQSYLFSEHKNSIMDDFCQKVIKEVDKSVIVSPELIQSPWLGAIPPSRLSGGSSMIISLYLINKYEDISTIYFKSSNIGDNCVPYLLELAQQCDIYMWLNHPLMYCDYEYRIADDMFNNYPNVFYSLDESRIVTNADDYLDLYIEWNIKYLDSRPPLPEELSY